MALLLAGGCTHRRSAGGAGTEPKRDIVETGTLAAVNVCAFDAPRYPQYFWNIRITGMLDHGTEVKAGDSIIQLDTKDISEGILNDEATLETQIAALQQLEINQQVNINAMELDIKSQQASFDLKKIELESSRYESDRIRRIKELEFQQAEIAMKMGYRKLELAKLVNSKDLEIAKVRIRRTLRNIENLKRVLELLTIRTPVSGVLQISRNPRTQVMVNVGDMATPNYSIASVPELAHMKVETVINEIDFLKIHTGQKVAVRLDAMPSQVFDGEIAYIGKLCHPRELNSREKVFDVEVTIDKYDERLKPGMTVSCEFLSD